MLKLSHFEVVGEGWDYAKRCIEQRKELPLENSLKGDYLFDLGFGLYYATHFKKAKKCKLEIMATQLSASENS